MKNIIFILSLLFTINLYANEATSSFIGYKKGTYSKEYTSAAKKCNNGEMKACNDLGWMFYTGKEVEENQKTALEYFKKSCSNDNSSACYILGTKSFRYEYKDISNISGFKKVEFLDKACNLKNPYGCSKLAMRYALAMPMSYKLDGIKKNLITAKSLYKLSCEYGYKYGCEKFAELKDQGIK